MRKHIIILLTAMLCLPLNAGAQWYLFPGKDKKQNQPFTGGKKKDIRTEDTLKLSEKAAVRDTLPVIPQTIPSPLDGEYANEPFDAVNVAMLIPINAGENASGNYLEMYCGAMLAARQMGMEGIKVNLNVYDSARGGKINDPAVYGNDVIIGPVSPTQIVQAAAMCPEDRFIVSPLDQKAEGMTDSLRIIQAPASWAAQFDELADWIAYERRQNKSTLYVIRDANHENIQGNYLISKLEDGHIPFKLLPSINRDAVPAGENTFVIASDRDDFLSTCIRELSLADRKKCKPVLYTTSKAKTLPIDSKVLYELETRMVATYFIDYSDPRVRDFILSYRALFNSEPGQFAFQGYDTVRFFIMVCSTYGHQWIKKLEGQRAAGLHSDFMFTGRETVGFKNTAVRRVLYSSETMSTALK